METVPPYLKMDALDLGIIQTLAGGKDYTEIEIFKEMLGIFLMEKSRQMAELQEAADEPHWERMNQTFHSMGGAAANLGLIRLTSATSYFERATTDVENEGLSDLVKSLESEFRVTLVQLHCLFPSLGLEERL